MYVLATVWQWPEFLSGDLPSWLAFILAGGAMVIAWALRRPQTIIKIRNSDALVRDSSTIRVTMNMNIAPAMNSFGFAEIKRAIYLDGVRMEELDSNADGICNSVFQGVHSMGLQISIADKPGASTVRLTGRLKLDDGTRKRLDVTMPVNRGSTN